MSALTFHLTLDGGIDVDLRGLLREFEQNRVSCARAKQLIEEAYAKREAEAVRPIYEKLHRHYPTIAGHAIRLEQDGETQAHSAWAALTRDLFDAENLARALLASAPAPLPYDPTAGTTTLPAPGKDGEKCRTCHDKGTVWDGYELKDKPCPDCAAPDAGRRT